MKKQYITPSTATIRTATQHILCGSITATESGVEVTLYSNSSGSFGDDNTINSRRGGFWDE